MSSYNRRPNSDTSQSSAHGDPSNDRSRTGRRHRDHSGSSQPPDNPRQSRSDSGSRQPRDSSGSRQHRDRSGSGSRDHYDRNPQNPRGKPPSGSSRGSRQPSDSSTSSQQPRDTHRQARGTGSSRPPGDSVSSQSSGGSPSLVGSGISMTPGGGQRHYSGPPASTGVSMRPQGGSTQRPASGQRGSNSTSLQDVDLNLSHGSETNSVVTLGGVEYPVGSRIGKSGMFVIGDPAGYSKHDTSGASSFRSSADPSTLGSHTAMYRGDGRGYNFEYWNWSIIRFVCFIFICIVKVGLLAGIIAVAVEHKKKCTAHFLWWQGATFYNIPVPYFYDTDNSNIGDMVGIEKKHGYFEEMGHGAIILEDFLWSEAQDWRLVSSFTSVDIRLGSASSLRSLVETLHRSDVRVLLRMCPWYTSTEHSWYIESRESAQNKFKDFYVWRDTPDTTVEGKWQFNQVRNQYYLHRDDSRKPVLDWTNPQLVRTFEEVLEHWLGPAAGVDGFVLCELDKFFVTNETQIMSILGRFHKILSDASRGEDSKRILVVDGTFVKNQTAKVDPATLLERIDLIEAPLILNSNNKTIGLQGQINSFLKYQATFDLESRPWILWRLDQLKGLPALDLGALQLWDLMLPGTPSYTAGQELGLFFQENADGDYQSPMLWQSEGVDPYNPGGSVPEHNLAALRNVSATRRDTFSLRLDSAPTDEPREINYHVLETDPDTDFLLFSRDFPTDNIYYFAVNLGPRDITKDLETRITPWATVLADSSGKYHGRLELRKVVLEAGQAIVFYPTK